MAVGGMLMDEGPAGDDANQKFTKEVFLVAVFSALGGFLFGYDTGIVSGAMVYIKTKDNLDLNDEWQELVISITILGAWIFSLVASPLATRYGRKKVVSIAAMTFTLGSLEMAAAWERWSLLIGRFVVGAAIGLASMVIPMFIAEIAPAKIRGSLVTTNNLFIAGGQAVAAVMAGVFGYIDGSLKWR
jgi:SP family myo-inositol transporter-like MFS transporter 13